MSPLNQSERPEQEMKQKTISFEDMHRGTIRHTSGGGMMRFQSHRLHSSSVHTATSSEVTSLKFSSVDDEESTTYSGGSHFRMPSSIMESSIRAKRVVKHISQQTLSCVRQGNRSSLRGQILRRFGITTALVIVILVGLAAFVALQAQNETLRVGTDEVSVWIQEKLGFTAHFMSDIITQRVYKFQGGLALIQTMTQERLVGYPVLLDDSQVPFLNELANGERRYPWNATELLPFQDEITPNVDASNAEEHIGSQRYEWFKRQQISTRSAMMVISTTSEAINTPEFEALHRKMSDFASPVLKSIYEHTKEIKSIEIHFANNGHGGVSTVYPAQSKWSMNNTASRNIGCDWLRLPNPFDPSRPIGNYKTRSNCETAQSSHNNILHQDFCRRQALNPMKHQVDGPLFDENGQKVMRFGKAIYDTYTHELIACLTLTVDALSLGRIDVGSVRSAEEDSLQMVILRWENNNVVFAEHLQTEAPSPSSESLNVVDLDMSIELEVVEQLKEYYIQESQKEQSERSNDRLHETHKLAVCSRWYISSYPSPPLPHQTLGNDGEDNEWYPQFLIISVMPVSLQDRLMGYFQHDLEPRTRTLIFQAIGAGVGSLLLVLFILYIVSSFLTRPLEWMHSVGTNILESAGPFSQRDLKFKDIDSQRYQLDLSRHSEWWYRFSPITDVKELVDQFGQMVKQFSGQGTAKLFKQQQHEVNNPFKLYRNFRFLYERRKGAALQSCLGPAQPIKGHPFPPDPPKMDNGATEASLVSDDKGELYRLHFGPNVSEFHKEDSADIKSRRIFLPMWRSQDDLRRATVQSRLFLWIICAIAVPLIIAMIAISVFFHYGVAANLAALVDVTGKMYMALEKDFFVPFTRLRAVYISEVVSTTIRDLHLFNRVAGWLFTGAIGLADDTFVKVAMTAESCKTFDPRKSECPRVVERLSACDCKWDDPWETECNTSVTTKRANQLLSYELLSEDAYANGHRNHTSFPFVGTSATTTEFWPAVQSLPGYKTTTFGKLDDSAFSGARVAASLSAIQIPLYNYVQQEVPNLKRTWGSYLAQENTGAYSGYAGCNFAASYSASVQYGHRAHSWNHDLCPNGKFGLDPRCLHWYVTGKGYQANRRESPLVMSPPTKMRVSDPHPQTRFVLPIIDTRTNELLGQTMVRFFEEAILETMTDRWTPLGYGSFHLMTLAGDSAINKDDVLIAPGFKFGDATIPLAEIMLPEDTCSQEDHSISKESCDNLDKFNEIVQEMHEGKTSLKSFKRTSSSGGEPEGISLTYAPVTVETFQPIDPSDFSRGVRSSKTDLYSVALGQTDEGIAQHFESDLSNLNEGLWRHLVVLIVATWTLFILLLIGLAWITISISLPVVQLLRLVKALNNQELQVEFPHAASCSCELAKLRSTLDVLHSILHVANMAFFLGEHEKAYMTMQNALKVFSKLRNRKAIGIVNNNLGNLMFAMYRTTKAIDSLTLCGFSRKKIIQKGSSYFRNSISLGEDFLKQINEEEGFSENYLIFMQQLSNRYFNRAMFLLTVSCDHADPQGARKQGLMDLLTCKDMDREVVDNGDREGFKGDREVYFELLMSRIKGLLNLMKLGYKDDWGIEEVFREAQEGLQQALKAADQSWFDHLGPAGHLQRLDSALIEYHLFVASKTTDETERSTCVGKAAEIAIRMLVEDEYVIGEGAMLALKALIGSTHYGSKEDYGEDPSDVRSKLFQYRHQIGETLSLAYSNNDIVSRECMNASNFGDFSMEVF